MFFAVIAASLMLSFCSPVIPPDTNNPPAATDFGPKFTVFVATTGSDANFGTNKNAPVKSISNAIATASALGYTNIYIASGSYTPGNGIMPAPYGVDIAVNNIHLIGGWNTSYTAISGYSTLDGNSSNLSSLIRIQNIKNIKLLNINIQNFSSIAIGAGFYITKASDITISNCSVNNIDSSSSAIVYLLNITNSRFSYNSIQNCFSSSSSIVNIAGSYNLKYYNNLLKNCNAASTGYLIQIQAGSSNLTFNSNIIGSTNNSVTAIGIATAVINHQLIGNIFVDNWLGYLYRYSTTATNDINVVNDTAFTKATISSGNKLTNF
jgi:hypothetical protein